MCLYACYSRKNSLLLPRTWLPNAFLPSCRNLCSNSKVTSTTNLRCLTNWKPSLASLQPCKCNSTRPPSNTCLWVQTWFLYNKPVLKLRTGIKIAVAGRVTPTLTGKSTRTRWIALLPREKRNPTKMQLNPPDRKDTRMRQSQVSKLNTNFRGCFSNGRLRQASCRHPWYLPTRSPISFRQSTSLHTSSRNNSFQISTNRIRWTVVPAPSLKALLASTYTWSSGMECLILTSLGNQCLPSPKTIRTRSRALGRTSKPPESRFVL